MRCVVEIERYVHKRVCRRLALTRLVYRFWIHESGGQVCIGNLGRLIADHQIYAAT